MHGDPFFLLYLHGFNSSPISSKARITYDYCVRNGLSDRIAIPELPHVPALAIEQMCAIIERQTLPVAIIGSSLGGYYATYLAEKFGVNAALVNPAVNPAELWHQHLGINRNYYSGREYEISEEHVQQLIDIDTPQVRYPEKFMLLVQTGDETLDYRLAVDKYKGSMSIIQQGGNHSFVNYADMLPDIFQFLATPH